MTRGCRGCRGPRRGRTRVTRVGRFQARSAIRDRGYPATLRGDGAVSLHACPCASSRPGKTPACSTPPPPRVSATGRPGTRDRSDCAPSSPSPCWRSASGWSRWWPPTGMRSPVSPGSRSTSRSSPGARSPCSAGTTTRCCSCWACWGSPSSGTWARSTRRVRHCTCPWGYGCCCSLPCCSPAAVATWSRCCSS